MALAILGCALIPRLPVKLMPSQALPRLTVSFTMPDASPRVVEQEVTAKIEGLMARIRGVKGINSRSDNGGGYVTVNFDKHTDMEQARFEASTLIRQAWPQMPDGVSYPSISASRTISQSARPVLSYTLYAPEPASVIMRYAEDNIRPAIGRIAGVDRVQLSGATPMEWRLTYDNDRLRALNLTPYHIKEAIASQSQSRFLGFGMTGEGESMALVIRPSADHKTDIDLSQIFIKVADGTVISLDRLLSAEHADAEPTSYYRVNGKTSIYCNIYAEENANQLDVAKRIRTAFEKLQLPAGYDFKINYDSTETITEELDKIYFRTGLTLLILLVFVALTTMNLRYTTVIVISLGLSLGVSAIFYYMLGIEIQLYSLAGITISLNLMIDNIIVLGDHYRRKKNVRVFTAILGATLTTIGALGIVFFLDDELRLNLLDFVIVVIVNLLVSLAASLWLVPALIDRLGVSLGGRRLPRRRIKATIRLNHSYGTFIRFARRWRPAFIIVAVLAFGIPVFILPKEIPDCTVYNKTFGSKKYNDNIRPWVDLILGGTLRLFVEDVYRGSYFKRDFHELALYISASLPSGSTLEQMNDLIKEMESFLAGYSEIRQFRTDIHSPNRAIISVDFTKGSARRGFPYHLKSEVISKAQTLGGGSWRVTGIDDDNFNNNVSESAGSYHVKLNGYNYDELESLADQFCQRLLTHNRIKEITVDSEFSWYKNDYTEFVLSLDREAMARRSIDITSLYREIAPIFGGGIFCTLSDGAERIYLSAAQSREYDVWALLNMPFTLPDGRIFRIGDIASLERITAPKSVVKENQQYLLCLQYNYTGSPRAGGKVLEKEMEAFRATLPLGYTITNPQTQYRWSDTSNTNYMLLALVIAIIFFIAAILFNSLMLPLIVIAMIPLSFIGVFLIFYLTGTNFDQGGFAAFVLLCGITVNAAIYLINEYNSNGGDYIRAFNAKIIPILLTVLSTILGFIPFLIGREAFWYPLALGTIGGLVASLIALFIFLPLLLPSRCSKQCHNASETQLKFPPETL